MRYLVISLFFCCISCTSYIKKNNFKKVSETTVSAHNPYFSDLTKDYVYKANIKVYDNNFSGIFIVKKISKSKHRIVFTTEMGAKIFDFTFHNNDFKVNYVIENLDKKLLLNVLEKDFRMLVHEQQSVINEYVKDATTVLETKIEGQTSFYEFTPKGKLTRIVRASKRKRKVDIIFSTISMDTAKNIQILHHNIKLNINLKAIN